MRDQVAVTVTEIGLLGESDLLVTVEDQSADDDLTGPLIGDSAEHLDAVRAVHPGEVVAELTNLSRIETVDDLAQRLGVAAVDPARGRVLGAVRPLPGREIIGRRVTPDISDAVGDAERNMQRHLLERAYRGAVGVEVTDRGAIHRLLTPVGWPSRPFSCVRVDQKDRAAVVDREIGVTALAASGPARREDGR